MVIHLLVWDKQLTTLFLAIGNSEIVNHQTYHRTFFYWSDRTNVLPPLTSSPQHFPFLLETGRNYINFLSQTPDNKPPRKTYHLPNIPLRLYLSGITTDVDLSRELGSVVDHGGLEATKAYLYQLHNVSADGANGDARHQRALCWKLLLGYLYLWPQRKNESSSQILSRLILKILEIWMKK